jgi:Protein of unknown function (DUF1634)
MESSPDRLNSRLAWLLALGTWASCTLIACGMLLQALGVSAPPTAEHLVSAGIVLLIALPTIRVATMSVWFLFHRDLDFTLIAAVVLAIIIASTLSGAGAAGRIVN